MSTGISSQKTSMSSAVVAAVIISVSVVVIA